MQKRPVQRRQGGWQPVQSRPEATHLEQKPLGVMPPEETPPEGTLLEGWRPEVRQPGRKPASRWQPEEKQAEQAEQSVQGELAYQYMERDFDSQTSRQHKLSGCTLAQRTLCRVQSSWSWASTGPRHYATESEAYAEHKLQSSDGTYSNRSLRLAVGDLRDHLLRQGHGGHGDKEDGDAHCHGWDV